MLSPHLDTCALRIPQVRSKKITRLQFLARDADSVDEIVQIPV